MPVAYPPAARLHSPSEYTAALKGQRSARGALFVVHTRKRPQPCTQCARLGMIISKRNAPLAVSRNTIKRVIREAFRLQRCHLAPVDIVFRLNARIPNISLRQLRCLVRSEADSLLQRVKQC